MSAIIIEHVNVIELPETWRAKLPAPVTERVTVWIKAEDSPAALALLDGLKPYAASATASAGSAYVSNATETGLYFDGVNKITTAPVTPPTLNDLINKQLGGTGNVATGAAGDPVVSVPFYKKPLVWIGVAVVAVIGYFAWKNN